MTDYVSSIGYLVIEGKRRGWNNEFCDNGRVVAVRTNKPAQLFRDQVAVKVTLKVPKLAFEALTPEAVIEVPEELVQRPVQVEAVDPCD
jgi:hypothetical protein